jgi:hypothetical protein
MRNAVRPINYVDFDIESLISKAPVKNAKGGPTIYIQTDKSSGIPTIQLGRTNDESTYVEFPFGANAFDMTQAALTGKMNLELSIRDPAMSEWARALDQKVLQLALDNKAEWWSANKNGVPSDDEVRSMYHPLVTSHATYPDRVKTKIVVRTIEDRRVPLTEVFRFSGTNKKEINRMDSKALVPYTRGVVVIEVRSVWIMAKLFGLSLSTTRVLLSQESVGDPQHGFEWDGDAPAEASNEGGSKDEQAGPSAPSDNNNTNKKRKVDSYGNYVQDDEEPGGHQADNDSMLFPN